MSLIYISHDIGIVNKVFDRIAVMYRGEIVELGPKKSIFDKPQHPYTRALINCIPRSGLVKEEVRLNTIPGYVRKRSAEEHGCPFAGRCHRKAGSVCDSTPPPKLDFSESRFLYCHIAADELAANGGA
jgi:oligopeptide/dipeptide ABC transporter ATP-binding protein